MGWGSILGSFWLDDSSADCRELYSTLRRQEIYSQPKDFSALTEFLGCEKPHSVCQDGTLGPQPAAKEWLCMEYSYWKHTHTHTSLFCKSGCLQTIVMKWICAIHLSKMLPDKMFRVPVSQTSKFFILFPLLWFFSPFLSKFSHYWFFWVPP